MLTTSTRLIADSSFLKGFCRGIHPSRSLSKSEAGRRRSRCRRAQAPEQTTARQQRTTGTSSKRRRAATYDENVAIARRVHAGESPAQVAADTGFAVSTVQATYRWAKREQLLDAEEATR
jgi:hypothetical protein